MGEKTGTVIVHYPLDQLRVRFSEATIKAMRKQIGRDDD